MLACWRVSSYNTVPKTHSPYPKLLYRSMLPVQFVHLYVMSQNGCTALQYNNDLS